MTPLDPKTAALTGQFHHVFFLSMLFCQGVYVCTCISYCIYVCRDVCTTEFIKSLAESLIYVFCMVIGMSVVYIDMLFLLGN